MEASDWRAQIEAACVASRVYDPDVVEAMVAQESSGDPWAYNPEPAYRWLWDVKANGPFRPLVMGEGQSKYPPADFHDLRGFHGVDADHEWWGQQASWGLMQLMGALARELGFKGVYLPELCDPEVNLKLGCGHLASLIARSNGDMWQAVAAYNGGMGGWQWPGPQAYAAKVRSRYDVIRGA